MRASFVRSLVAALSLRRGLAIASTIALLLAALAAPANATFSGTNGRITFARYLDSTNGLEIFSAMPDGSAETQLTSSGQDHSSILSDWSPDGTKIAFDSDRTDDVQIFTMNWDGSGVTQLTTGAGFHGDPAWSPDGSQIAIESDWNDYPAQQGIWIVPSSDSDGVTIGEATRVTAIPAGMNGDSEPQFSPDGQWIVFTRFRSCKFIEHGRHGDLAGCLQAIFKVHPDSTGLTQLTGWGPENSAPDWSPDGTKITFDSGDVGKVGSKGDVWVMNADGSLKTRLTNNPPVSNVGQDFANFRFPLANNPVWSPDGTKILFSQWQDGGFPVWLISVSSDGSNPTVVVNGDFYQNKVDWGTHP
jgi:Tol biopolymer transport system component